MGREHKMVVGVMFELLGRLFLVVDRPKRLYSDLQNDTESRTEN